LFRRTELWQASIIDRRVSVLSKDEVERARVGRKIYGFKRYLCKIIKTRRHNKYWRKYRIERSV